MNPGFRLVDLLDAPPLALDALAAIAGQEGCAHVARLAAEHRAGGVAFRAPGCGLLGATAAGADRSGLIGVGGVTPDSVDPTMLRMRRFYVHPGFRRTGIGARLVAALLTDARQTSERIVVHAGDGRAAAFWERMGFAAVTGKPHSHEFSLHLRNGA